MMRILRMIMCQPLHKGRVTNHSGKPCESPHCTPPLLLPFSHFSPSWILCSCYRPILTGIIFSRCFMTDVLKNFAQCSHLTLYRVIIGPESDHWQCLSLTDSLTNSLIHWLPFSKLDWCDAYSKLVDVVTVVDVSDEDRVGNSLLQIWKLRFGHKA